VNIQAAQALFQPRRPDGTVNRGKPGQIPPMLVARTTKTDTT